ncbi:hypothetical protein ACS0TY_035261 [Phlomoides rotata]
MDKLPIHGASSFVLIAWNIWKARNMRIFESTIIPPHEITRRVLNLLAEFQPVGSRHATNQKARQSIARWNPLRPDDDGTFGLGFVVRDDQGLVLMAGSKRCFSAGSSTLAKALALRFGLEKVREVGLGRVQVESDSEIMVMNCEGRCSGEAHVMMLVEDIRSMVDIVQGIEITHCRRDANKMAHTLVRRLGTNANLARGNPDICNPFILDDVRREPINH